ncbi:Histidine--tRNA ligase [Candidatus Hodgkinia cicadicola]|uniref:Histidine--tRNA ligase n=1 Tax=Candidatus Hodgkinia cicadicola TaxID=573658 RepID=A0ABX4MHM7_9HYPH|nr:Histidine--tRNA ligase [Candidatus Hodgkinia cicadicola]
MNIIKTNLVKLSKIMGFEYIQVPLMINNKIRPDLTSALVTLPFQQIPMLNYKFGQVFRPERHTDLGRTNQFEQFDFDITNLQITSSEMLLYLILNSFLSYLNLELCNLVLGNINILNGICDLLGVNCYPKKRSDVITILDKATNLSFTDLKQLLITGKHDEGGEFIYGAGLTPEVITHLLSKLWTHSIHPTFKINKVYTNLNQTFLGSFGVHELFSITLISTITGIKMPSLVINPLLARNLSYYTANIFELQPTCPCCNSFNVFVRVGSLLAGGRYDNLIHNQQGSIPSIGYSIGISRLLEYHSSISRCFKSPTINTVCICWSQLECFNPNILTNIANLKWLGLRIKLLGGVSLQTSIKFANNSDILLYKWQEGWLVKNMLTYQTLPNRILMFKLWKNVFSDQFWTNNLNINPRFIKYQQEQN